MRPQSRAQQLAVHSVLPSTAAGAAALHAAPPPRCYASARRALFLVAGAAGTVLCVAWTPANIKNSDKHFRSP